jgi:hypothetical protein
MDGPTPQYHAQKATAGKSVMYGSWSPRKGFSARRISKAKPIANSATALLPLVEFAEFCVRQADIGFQFQSLDLPLKQVD